MCTIDRIRVREPFANLNGMRIARHRTTGAPPEECRVSRRSQDRLPEEAAPRPTIRRSARAAALTAAAGCTRPASGGRGAMAPAIAQRIVDAVIDNCRRTGQLSDADLATLHFVVPGGQAFRVRGTRPYRCTSRHCSCPAFNNIVVLHATAAYCKHQIAAMIADTLHLIQNEVVVSDDAFAKFAVDDSTYLIAVAGHEQPETSNP
ncbi:unnamed protein product (mitochondrion) [Plasmodiophora brassicae]|uniref:SWIM-type domain-containing protein n=1 Tax=Plasmodiophora brassicae TaxID=37360 RepID=A0A3P3Y3X7_PLABS|nr:unnamed protein product [Plasmodiophora brassicae]